MTAHPSGSIHGILALTVPCGVPVGTLGGQGELPSSVPGTASLGSVGLGMGL